MSKKIGRRRQAKLIQDIFNAEHDVVGLAASHHLSPGELARWIGESENQQCLSGLCMLADLQTQLMLSRYRLVAVTKLIKQATQQEEGVSAEQARKACVDLLKLDLKRADLRDAVEGPLDEAEDAGDLEQLRQMLYRPDAGG